MARPLRILFPNAWYHVMNRGRRRDNVFPDDTARKAFLGLLQEASDLWQLRVSTYCLMGNHYHLLVQTPLGNLPRCMQHIDGAYTQKTNKRHGWEGQLFRGRYKAILVDKDAYLLEVLRYIHRNPLRDGLVARLEDYEWSGHRAYLSSASKWDWLHKDFLLAMLSPDAKRRRAAYLELVRQPDPREMLSFYASSRPKPILGALDFLKGLGETLAQARHKKRLPKAFPVGLSPGGVKKAVAAHFGLPEEDLARGRPGVVNPARNLAVHLARRLTGENLAVLAAEFGFASPGSVGAALRRHRRSSERDAEIRRAEAELLSSMGHLLQVGV